MRMPTIKAVAARREEVEEASSERVDERNDAQVAEKLDVAAASESAPPQEQPREASVETAAPVAAGRTRSERPFIYVCAFVLFTTLCLAGVWRGNQMFAPEMYHSSGPIAFAEAFSKGQNFATFDLNINIRDMRNEHIARLKETPEVVVLGASHWQEGHTELLPKMNFYNAHVHRDYYEDMLAMVEMFVRHDKLPPKMIIAIRDRLFTPVADRTDFLWLPGIPYYEAMARRLGFEPHSYWTTMPVQRWRELASVKMLYSNALRWYTAEVKPHAATQDHFETLDTLRPGGSIYWSAKHQEIFTPERSERLSIEFAEQNVDSPPKIDPLGIKTLDRLFAFLKKNNVEVSLVHPPFNPIYYNRVKDGAYRKGLAKIEQITRDFAAKYGFKVFGSFNPADVGCTADMYIDAEHSNPECLGKVFKEYSVITAPKPDTQSPEAPAPTPDVVAAVTASPAVKKPDTVADPAKSDGAALDAPVIAARREKAVDGAALDAPVVTARNQGAASPSVRSAPERATTVAAEIIPSASLYPPLPSKRPSAMPPLPVRNPFIAHADCVAPGSFLQRNSRFEQPLRGTILTRRSINVAIVSVEQTK